MARDEPLGSLTFPTWRRDRLHAAESPASAAVRQTPRSLDATGIVWHGMAPAEVAAAARQNMLMAAGAQLVYLVCVWLAAPAFGIDMRLVALVIAATITLDLVLASTAAVWSRSRLVGVLYGCPQMVTLTVLLYVIGGLRASFLVLVYTVTLFRTAVLGSTAAVFITANVATLAFGALAYLEVTESIPLQAHFALLWVPTAGQALTAVVATCIILNLVALYASRSSYHLRQFAAELQDRVAERTAELTAANAGLWEKAHALQEQQDEFRTVVDGITHELKGPFNAVLLTADFLREREGAALTEEGRQDLERIVRISGAGEDMIRDLLRLFEITTAFE